MIKPITKYKGCMKLSAIGDALGWMTEFTESKQSLLSYFGTEIIDMYYPWTKYSGGRFYGYKDKIASGSYSDDTQMVLCIARCIGKDGKVDNERFVNEELRDWLLYQRGAGHTLKTAAKNLQKHSIRWYSNFYKDKTTDYRQAGANGAAMRMLPIALTNIGDEEKCLHQIFLNSIITHGHPRAIIGAMLYGYSLSLIITLQPKNFSWESFLTRLGLEFPRIIAINNFMNDKIIVEWIKKWDEGNPTLFKRTYDQTITEVVKLLRKIFISIKHNFGDKAALKELGCYEKESKGSGTCTVAAGLYYALKYSNEPTLAIINSVNSIGSDTDSIAAFAGGLLGALHGQNIIPAKWRSIQDATYIEDLAKRLLSISEDKYCKENKNSLRPTSFENDKFNIDDELCMNSLGIGKILNIDKQPTVTKGKYNLILDVNFECGQSVRIVKMFNYIVDNNQVKEQYKKDIIKKELASIQKIPTLHGVGLQRVLCLNEETKSNISQIAVTELKANDNMIAHMHVGMEIFFIIEKGRCIFTINGKEIIAKAGSYFQLPVGVKYSIKAIKDTRMITINVQYK